MEYDAGRYESRGRGLMKSCAAICAVLFAAAPASVSAADIAVLKAPAAEPATFAQRATWEVTVASEVRYFS